MKRVLLLSLFIVANLLAIADQSSITFTTTKSIGESLNILIDAPDLVQPNVWIDLNNNTIQDAGEAIPSFNAYKIYVIGAQTITIYGDITKLIVATCMLSSIDVSNNPFLEHISCANNSISTLDVTQNTNLKHLECYQNNLTNVDVSHNPDLELYFCGINPMIAVDVSQNTNLKHFYCWQTLVTRLDLSHNPSLLQVYIEELNVTELNLANGHNSLITVCDFFFCPNLECVQIDDGFTPGNTWYKDAHTNYSTIGCTPVTGVSLNKESTSLNIGDSELLVATITPDNASISDVSWTTSNSSIATIDGSGNVTAIAEGVANIIVTTVESSFKDTCEVTVNGPSRMTIRTTRTSGQNWRLWLNAAEDDKAGVWLDLNNNGIREAGEDPQGYNAHYEYPISSQILTVYGKVTVFYCWGNDLMTIDVTHNPYLEGLSFAHSSISEVDLSHNPLLNLLVAHTSNLYCLDLSANPLLTRVYVETNALEYLNLANGNNSNFTNCSLSNNIDLECVQIDAGFTPPINWYKDAQTNYSVAACPPYIPSYTLELEKSSLYIIGTNRDLKRQYKSSVLDTIRVKPTLSVKEKLTVITSSFPADNFELLVMTFDENGDEVLLPTTPASNDSVEFQMPTQKVALSVKYNIPSSDELSVPNSIPFLELHENSSLTNQPISEPTQIGHKIMYKRVFEPNQWHSICFPFEVSKVTVMDGGIEYELAACSSSQSADGNYYLKCITNAVGHDDMESSWDWETTITKNKSYIIAFPSTYYTGKEIIFYGDAQTINDASNVFTPTTNTGSTNYSYACNNSFNDQTIQDPYLLSDDGHYFVRHIGSYILKPFMSYVHSVTAPSMAPMNLSFEDIVGPKKDPTHLDELFSNGSFEFYIHKNEVFVQSPFKENIYIYAEDGRLVKSIQLLPNIQISTRLESGVYFIQSRYNQVHKIIIL